MAIHRESGGDQLARSVCGPADTSDEGAIGSGAEFSARVPLRFEPLELVLEQPVERREQASLILDAQKSDGALCGQSPPLPALIGLKALGKGRDIGRQ